MIGLEAFLKRSGIKIRVLRKEGEHAIPRGIADASSPSGAKERNWTLKTE